jgi:crossover junction endodeoxyribonuclease RuvC
MNYIGIDPGLHGSITIIYPDTIETSVIPTTSQGKKKIYDHLALAKFFYPFEGTKCYAILEQQHPMPKQGVTSMFSIGYGFGALKQCLVDFAIPHEVVRAQVWQKEFGISGRNGNTKVQALQICQSLFPDLNLLATEKSKKPHEGIVDAVLIAEFAKRRYGGKTRE